MNSRTKNILIGVLLVGIISMTIVYATLSQQLNISGSAKVQSKSQSWNIHFQHITNTANEVQVEQYATVQSSSISLTDTNTTATLPTVTFKAPGDKVTYLFDVINEGDITGYINVINDISIPDVSGAETYKAAIIKTFTYADDTPIAVNNSIAKNEVKHLKVILQLSSDLETLPNAEVTFSNITASLVYGQDQVSGGNSGNGGNTPVPSSSYVYVGPNTATTAENFNGFPILDEEWPFYARTNTLTDEKELCVVGSGGTVCINPENIELEDFEAGETINKLIKSPSYDAENDYYYCEDDNIYYDYDESNNICTACPEGYEEDYENESKCTRPTITGYVAQKETELLSKGFTCEFYPFDSPARISCSLDDLQLSISNDTSVEASFNSNFGISVQPNEYGGCYITKYDNN